MEMIKKENLELLPSPAKCAEIFAQLKEIEKLGEKFKAMLKDDVTANPEAYAGIIGLKPTGSTTEITDAKGAYSVLVDQAGLTTPEEFLRAVKLPVTAVEKICKAALSARDIPVKNHRAEIESLLGDLIIKKEKAPSLELL